MNSKVKQLIQSPCWTVLLKHAAIFLWIFFAILIAVKMVFVDRPGSSYEMGKNLEYLEDGAGTLSIHDVSAPWMAEKFLQHKAENPSFGFTRSAYWFRLTVPESIRQAHSSKEWMLEIGYPLIDDIQLYLPDAKAGFVSRCAGDMLPFSFREAPSPNFLFRVDDIVQQGGTMYLRIKTASAMQFTIGLKPLAFYAQHEQYRFLGYGLYFGMIFVMMFYNFFIYLAVRDRNYLLHVFYIMCFLLWQVSASGLGFQFFWPENPWWANRVIPFSISLLSVISILFSRSILNTSQGAPLLDKALKALMAASIILAGFSLFADYGLIIQAAVFNAILVCLLLFFAGYFLFFRGCRSARFYVMGWTVLLSGTIVLAVSKFGVLPKILLTEYAQQMGAVLEILLLSFAIGDRINMLQKEKQEIQRRANQELSQTNASLSRFVPAQFLSYLGRDSIVDVQLGDHIEQKMTIMFADIRSFTAMSENMSPEENFKFLNSYLKRIGPIIRKHNGFIDKYIGDEIMALFPCSPGDALRCAAEMQQEIKTYNWHRYKSGYAPIRVGIGIHTGKLMLGTIGEEQRMESTVISDAVNLASRLENLTGVFGTSIIVSEQTLAASGCAADFLSRYIGRIQVKGKNENISIFEIFDADDKEKKDKKIACLDDYMKGAGLYIEKRYHEAQQYFEKVLSVNREDIVAMIFYKNCIRCKAKPSPRHMPMGNAVKLKDTICIIN